MTAFVDSSAWFASVFAKDRHNARAKAVLSAEALVTTDAVILETWLLLARRFHHAAAERFWAGIRSGAAQVERVLQSDFDAAWEIGATFPDQQFSIVDRTSFAVMERLGLSRVASFDDDFAIYRYGPNRDRAFEVLR
ncbi:MAG TPA: PIN domain-containing protein [Hyphomicrobiaceae bacterium]|nr:PIN domain-containing protein [Hyphomicrobiaceae bacterium]